jgi:hypothetical protein
MTMRYDTKGEQGEENLEKKMRQSPSLLYVRVSERGRLLTLLGSESHSSALTVVSVTACLLYSPRYRYILDLHLVFGGDKLRNM